MQQRRALGRGLDSLIPSTAPPEESTPTYPGTVPVDMISPNRQQPRQIFDEDTIRELADSIREQGIIQPLIVSELSGGRYELIAGERRLRAARLLGLEEVPVIVKSNVDEEGLLTMALIENLQREDLNPIEEARALRELIDQQEYSQEEVATKVGKSRTYVANSIRLLRLPQVMQDDLAAGRYSAGHARAVLALTNLHEQLKLREYIIKQMPTVRDVEQRAQARAGAGGKTRKRSGAKQLSPQVAMILDEMTQSLGTKVRLKVRSSGAGQVVVDFYSMQDLDRVYRRIVS